MSQHFKIIVPFYNVEDWIMNTIRSVKAQDHTNFQCVLINDISTDNTLEVARKEIGSDSRFDIIDNKEKKYVLQNFISGIEYSEPDKEDVIITLDGDDWFARKEVLSILEKTYKEKDCWLTYGSYVEYPSLVKGKFSRPVPESIIKENTFRESPWMTSHLRSWKYGLWKKVDQDRSFFEPDPVDENNHFANCWDLAYMFPLIEMAANRMEYIDDVLYVYNRKNPLNVDKINHMSQLQMEQKIRGMKKYDPLKEL